MDRTLLDTAVYAGMLMDAAKLTPQHRRDAEAVLSRTVGDSFDFLEYIMQTGHIKFEALHGYMLAHATEHVLMPGVHEFIDTLDATGEAYGILTTGAAQNQQLKLDILRKVLNKTTATLPAEITAVPNKSADFVMMRWRPGKKAFYIGTELSGVRGGRYAQRVLLVDDKQSNLTTPHVQLTAFHVPVDKSTEAHTLKSVSDYIKHTAL